MKYSILQNTPQSEHVHRSYYNELDGAIILGTRENPAKPLKCSFRASECGSGSNSLLERSSCIVRPRCVNRYLCGAEKRE